MSGPTDLERPASNADEERRHRSSLRHNWGVALLGAAVVIVPTLIGGGVAQSKGALHLGALPTVTQTVTATATIAAPRQPSLVNPSPDATRAGSITLSNGYCVDLDSAASDWSVSSACPTVGAINGGADLRYIFIGNQVDMLDDADISQLTSGDAGSDAFCRSVTAYEQSLAVRALRVGQRFCVRTSSQNYALMQITALDAPDNDLANLRSATFAVTRWGSPS